LKFISGECWIEKMDIHYDQVLLYIDYKLSNILRKKKKENTNIETNNGIIQWEYQLNACVLQWLYELKIEEIHIEDKIQKRKGVNREWKKSLKIIS